MEQNIISCGVLVIGGGGAALRAAIAAKERGADVLLVSKKRAGRSGATYYSVAEVGAFNVPDGVLDPSDGPEAFYDDMCEAALSMARLPLCQLLAERATGAMEDLERIGKGAVFAKENGRYKAYQACFSTKPRAHVVENHFKPILSALLLEVSRLGIPVRDDCFVTGLLTDGGQVAGAYCLGTDGTTTIIRAKSVILAAGGASRLFQRNMYPADITGDGYAMAFRAGAVLTNMEFIQVGVGVASPFINLFGNYLWEGRPLLRNGQGQAFLEHYLPKEVTESDVMMAKTHFPFSTRDLSRYIEIAMQGEVTRGGGTKNGTVYLDFRGVDFCDLESRHTNFSSMWAYTHRWHLEKGIDLLHEPVEIACFAHAINGGILIDTHSESTLPGLYSAGENAAGPHGADRLGGNMSVSCQVFGKLAGEAAAERAAAMSALPEPSAAQLDAQRTFLAQFSKHGTQCLGALLARLQVASQGALLVIRNEAALTGYLAELEQLEQVLRTDVPVCTPEDLIRAVELQNLLDTGRMIASAALQRRESRGSHYRADYPELGDADAKNLLLSRQSTTRSAI